MCCVQKSGKARSGEDNERRNVLVQRVYSCFCDLSRMMGETAAKLRDAFRIVKHCPATNSQQYLDRQSSGQQQKRQNMMGIEDLQEDEDEEGVLSAFLRSTHEKIDDSSEDEAEHVAATASPELLVPSNNAEEGKEDESDDNEVQQIVYQSQLLPEPLVLHQRARKGIAHQLWPAATFLCTYLDAHRDEVFPNGPCKVLELGAGIGLCGLLAAALGHSVVLTDLPEALPGLQENIERNNLQDRATAVQLAWGTDDHLQPEIDAEHTDVVLVADCVYWPELFDPLLQTLCAIVQHGAVVYMAHVRRWKRDSKFFAAAKKRLQVDLLEEVVSASVHEAKKHEPRSVMRLYRITRRQT